MTFSSRTAGIIATFCLVSAVATLSGTSGQSRERNPANLVTLVLHQADGQSIEEFKAQLDKNHFRQEFPPDGVEIVSWTGAVGLGHVITMRMPNYKLPEVRRIVDARGWGNIKPEIYPAYDFEPFWQDMGGTTHRTPPAPEPYRASSQRMLIAP